MSYHKFKSALDGEEYGSFEVFYETGMRVTGGFTPAYTPPAGWYWWACFPGCMPDSEQPHGPFATEQEAIDDAQEGA